MDDHSIKSKTVTNMVNDNKKEELSINASQNKVSTDRPTTLNTITSNRIVHENVHRYNINDIHMTPSPMDVQPRLFQPGTIIESHTFQRIQTSVYNKPNKIMIEEEEEEEEEEEAEKEEKEKKMNFDNEQDLNEILNNARDQEIQQLSQFIIAEQPINNEAAEFIVKQLDLALDSTKTITNMNVNDTIDQQVLTSTSIISTTTTTTQQQHSYPPMNQTGHVEDHDRPYAQYGHLNRQIIAQECNFNLQPSASHIPRLHAKSFAITSMTNVSKELVMNNIKEEFGIENIQYICISEEISELNHQQHLHIQIIFKEKVDRRKPFLDEITQTHCNYQVTQNDLAWNEYIKKDGNSIEFNEFKSTKARGSKQWSPSSPSPSRSCSRSSSVSSVAAAAAAPAPAATATTAVLPITATTFDHHHNQSLVPPRATTVRGQAEEKRQHQLTIYKQAVQLAKINVDHAMDLIEREMIDKFVEHGTWYLAIFNYVHLRAQREADQRGEIDKDYIWSNSFPNCTPQLREAVNRWINEEFNRLSRAKCLILIGPTGTGKTSFALSLPGRVNYFKERWNLDTWSDYARYSVYDDIPWDDFAKLNYPNKKGLLTQNGKLNATDKYRGTKQINVRQPAIVLLNPEDAGSLLVEPITIQQQKLAEYWKERAFIYIMGPDEYFYKSNTHIHNDNNNKSNDLLTSTNEERLGEPDEFDRMIQRYQQKHSK